MATGSEHVPLAGFAAAQDRIELETAKVILDNVPHELSLMIVSHFSKETTMVFTRHPDAQVRKLAYNSLIQNHDDDHSRAILWAISMNDKDLLRDAIRLGCNVNSVYVIPSRQHLAIRTTVQTLSLEHSSTIDRQDYIAFPDFSSPGPRRRREAVDRTTWPLTARRFHSDLYGPVYLPHGQSWDEGFEGSEVDEDTPPQWSLVAIVRAAPSIETGCGLLHTLTPLHLACIAGNSDFVHMLIAAGADVQAVAETFPNARAYFFGCNLCEYNEGGPFQNPGPVPAPVSDNTRRLRPTFPRDGNVPNCFEVGCERFGFGTSQHLAARALPLGLAVAHGNMVCARVLTLAGATPDVTAWMVSSAKLPYQYEGPYRVVPPLTLAPFASKVGVPQLLQTALEASGEQYEQLRAQPPVLETTGLDLTTGR